MFNYCVEIGALHACFHSYNDDDDDVREALLILDEASYPGLVWPVRTVQPVGRGRSSVVNGSRQVP